MYKVSEFAKLFHINTSLLRYYDKEGIFSPEYRDPQTGYRFYTARQIYPFSTMISARDMGFPLEDLKNHKDAASFFDDNFIRMKRKHDQFQVLLRDLQALREPEEHRIFAYTYPSIFAVKRDYRADGADDSWDILTQAALELIGQGLSVEYAHASHLIFHDDTFPHTAKTVTCCLSVKQADHPWVEEIPETRYICIHHYGARNEISTAYRILKNYIKERNLDVCGNPSERYIRKKALPRQRSDILCEIRFPLGAQW